MERAIELLKRLKEKCEDNFIKKSIIINEKGENVFCPSASDGLEMVDIRKEFDVVIAILDAAQKSPCDMGRCFSKLEIIDKYSHIGFIEMTCLSQIRVGMMVQVCDNNHIPLSWEWVEVTESRMEHFFKALSKDRFKWIRIPNY